MGLLRFLILEPVVNGIIVLSTIAMVMLGFAEHGSGHYKFWVGVDIACVVYFVAEAAIKIWQFGWKPYWSQRWNQFDFVITVLCLPVLMIPFTDSKLFIGFPVLRLARLFRLFRLLRFIPERDRLSAGVVRALKASVGVFLAVMLVNFIFAMGAHILFGGKAGGAFADPARSSYSMFQVFTVEGWYELPEKIAATSDATWATFARIYFGVAVLVGGILGLSLGNAVFVDQMTSDNTDDLEQNVEDLSAEITSLREEIRALRSALKDR